MPVKPGDNWTFDVPATPMLLEQYVTVPLGEVPAGYIYQGILTGRVVWEDTAEDVYRMVGINIELARYAAPGELDFSWDCPLMVVQDRAYRTRAAERSDWPVVAQAQIATPVEGASLALVLLVQGTATGTTPTLAEARLSLTVVRKG